MNPARRPIGVFDSGVGGLTVVRALRRALPGEDIIYLGDTARVPYGSKSPRTVERYSLTCQRFLLERGVKLVMVACNTASASALPALARASAVPVVGAVEPGAQAALAASQRRRIGVLGTLTTIRSRAYERAIAARAPEAVVTGSAAPLLVPLAEEGWTEDDIARAVCRRYLGELFSRDAEIDTVVLGCTHYPLLVSAIAEAAIEIAGRPIAVVDSATAMAAAARAEVGGGDGGPGADLDLATGRGDGAGQDSGLLSCFVTDASRLDELAPRFLGEPLGGFELVDIV